MAMATRRRIAAALTLTTLALTAATGCGAVDKALDCVRTADAIATSADNLQQAVSNATSDPTQASEALDEIDKEIGELGDKTGDADLGKAITGLRNGVANVREAIDKGDATPDIGPVTDAAAEIGKVCTS
ncbi:hypothetical protein [Streptomyces sp. NPDC092952]|uniref:hypothetical protein n=1 Tax=Streptomyces sp. NPDC092952 TaxID=3366018 RepID=UPI00382ACE66